MVAVALATVDRERAARSLAGLAFRPAPDDEALGASTLAAPLPDGTLLLLLEPRTEGRLAAFLARHGEGPAAAYLADLPAPDAPLRASPLGRRARLLPSRARSGPFVLAVERLPSDAMVEATIEIRPARLDDAEAIAALFTDEGYPAGPSDILERLSRFDSEYSTVHVAHIAGEVVGFVAVHVMPRFEHSDRIARVLALVVDPGVRERGLGHQLMEEAERIARETGCAFIEVTAGHHRPDALQLYESMGYDPAVAAYLRKRL